jgi:dGTPase
LLDWLVSGLMEGTVEAVDAASVGNVETVRAHPRRLAAFTLPAHAANRALKQFLHHTLYYSEPMAGERRRSAAQIAELFEFWIAHPDKLPENYVESLSSSPVHRVVCDYIAGMTDGYFLRCYQQTIVGPSSM